MVSMISAAVTLVAQSTGRGEDATDAGGVLIVVGIAVLAVLIVAGALLLVVRARRAKRLPHDSAEPQQRSLPSEQGRPWSSERPEG